MGLFRSPWEEAVTSEADLLSNASAWMGYSAAFLTGLRSHTGKMR